MTEEDAFIRAITASPRDEALRLLFADWLEERGDPRGEALRILLRLEQLSACSFPPQMKAKLARVREIAALQKRFRQLRVSISDEWILRVARGPIEECNRVGFGVKCPGAWEMMPESDVPGSRRCQHCSREVRFCWSAADVHEAICSRHPVVKAVVMERTEPPHDHSDLEKMKRTLPA